MMKCAAVSWCGDTVCQWTIPTFGARAASWWSATDPMPPCSRHGELDEAAGDAEGCAVWERILEAVADLTRTTPAEGERVQLRIRPLWCAARFRALLFA